MHERAAAIDAQLTVESQIGEGTSVRVAWSEP
jgi:signal transduction histidine kinase